MAKWKHYYLVRIEFLGFRYHGWQKQAGFKSVHGMIDKTLLFILGHEDFRTLGCGRTDAKVSADDYAFELFANKPLISNQLLKRLNTNLPSDIRAKSVEEVNESFNIIQDSKEKEYHYHFSFGEKSHPVNAPLIRDFGKSLNIEQMMKAATVFEGSHNFQMYVSKPSPHTDFKREILSSAIEKGTKFTGNFVPENYFVFKVTSKGFMRYQVRLMMGALVDVGRSIWSIDQLENSLQSPKELPMKHVAPSSGLCLHRVQFD